MKTSFKQPSRYASVFFSVFICVLSVGALVAPPASAHKGTQSYVFLRILSNRVEGRVDLRIADLNEITGMGLPQKNGLAAVETSRGQLEKYALEHFSLSLRGSQLPVRFTTLEFLEEPGANSSYVIMNFTTPKQKSSIPRVIGVRYDAIFHAKPDRDAWFLVMSDWDTGTFKREGRYVATFKPGTEVQDISLGKGSWFAGFRRTVGLGIQHIRIGTDHILFVLTLLLPSVLVFRKKVGWAPTAGFVSSLRRVLKIATSFTIAHSITLGLAGLDVIKLPSKFVESAIAISIALAALHNFRPIFANKEWAVAFVFGLFHGFGFASLLGDLGLKSDRRVSSLLGFNLGVEVGQVAIILMIFPALFLLRRVKIYDFVLKLGSGTAAVLALGWTIERVFGVNLRIAKLTDPFVVFPRVLIGIVILLAAALTLHLRAKKQGALLPVYAEAS
jgi:HupE / UreJ protein